MKRILVIGAGGRVTDAVLPALARLGGKLELGGVFARKERDVEARGPDTRGAVHRVRPLASLTASEVAAAHLVYVVVAKPAVGRVLTELARFDVAHVELVLETPVVLFKHLHHVRRVAPFARASVAEDLCALPWMDLVRRATVPDGALGAPRHVELDRSGYAYHGVALAKALLGAQRVSRGRRRRTGGTELRTLRFVGGTAATWTSPRDYSVGAVTLTCARGVASDRPAPGVLPLRPLLSGARQVGVQLGDDVLGFDDDEGALCTAADPSASLTTRMQDMKRIGLLRLFRGLAEGRPAYPLTSGLDDMLVDYHLEKLGHYVANPLTSAGGALRPVIEGALGLVDRLRRH